MFHIKIKIKNKNLFQQEEVFKNKKNLLSPASGVLRIIFEQSSD